jgi:hypothetical protein
MGIAEAAAALIVTLLPLLGWWLQRKMQQAEAAQPQQDREAFDAKLAKPDLAAAALDFDDVLRDAERAVGRPAIPPDPAGGSRPGLSQ